MAPIVSRDEARRQHILRPDAWYQLTGAAARELEGDKAYLREKGMALPWRNYEIVWLARKERQEEGTQGEVLAELAGMYRLLTEAGQPTNPRRNLRGHPVPAAPAPAPAVPPAPAPAPAPAAPPTPAQPWYWLDVYADTTNERYADLVQPGAMDPTDYAEHKRVLTDVAMESTEKVAKDIVLLTGVGTTPRTNRLWTQFYKNMLALQGSRTIGLIEPAADGTMQYPPLGTPAVPYVNKHEASQLWQAAFEQLVREECPNVAALWQEEQN